MDPGETPVRMYASMYASMYACFLFPVASTLPRKTSRDIQKQFFRLTSAVNVEERLWRAGRLKGAGVSAQGLNLFLEMTWDLTQMTVYFHESSCNRCVL